MPIKFLRGDLLSANSDLIVHGVNCKGAFGSGIAGQIRKQFPSAYDDYIYKYKSEGWELGEIQFSRTNMAKPRFIVNCATQINYGNDGRQYADYNAIKDCLTAVVRFAARENYSIAMPKIGAGLGGLDWQNVFTLVSKISLSYPDVNVSIYSLEAWE